MVIKLTHSKDAEKQTRIAKQIHELIEKNRFKIRSPIATTVDLPGTDFAIYVEEKLPLGMNEKEHQEFWARIFIHIKSTECSPIFSENLLKIAKEISELVLKIGIWDIGEKNLPEVASNGQYLCATDFENVSEDLSNVHQGLSKLAYLFCHDPCIEYLENQYIQSGLESAFTQHKDWIKKDFGDAAYEGFMSKNSQEMHLDNWKKQLRDKHTALLRLQETLLARDEKEKIEESLMAAKSVKQINNVHEGKVAKKLEDLLLTN
jgi:hypothetical protein